MKKIIMGAAVAAILSTSAFAQVLDSEDIKSGVYDNVYVETAVGVNNGNNDGILTIGYREYVKTDLLGFGLIDLSGTVSMENQLDINARYTVGNIEGMFVFGSVGAESYNVHTAEGCSGELIDDLKGNLVCTDFATPASETSETNIYGELGMGTLLTHNWGIMVGGKVGTTKVDVYAETLYQVESDIYVTAKVGQSIFDTVNDNQHDGLTALVGVGYSF